MKYKIIIPIILSLGIGVYLGIFIFKQYKEEVKETFEEKELVYFLQQGVYESIENLTEHTKMISDYIYFKEDDMYKVYVGITTSKENAEKIKRIFNEKKYDIYIKEIVVSNLSFVEKLKQYDELIRVTDDDTVILGIVKQVLGEYEMMMKSE